MCILVRLGGKRSKHKYGGTDQSPSRRPQGNDAAQTGDDRRSAIFFQ
jgi:hypothetical protein